VAHPQAGLRLNQRTLDGEAGADQAVEQDRQHDQREGYVEAVAFQGEADYGERDPHDGSRDQEEQAELDEALSPAGEHALNHAGNGAEVGRLTAEDAIVGGFGGVAGDVDAGSDENDDGGERDSAAQDIAEHQFQTAVIPKPRFALHALFDIQGRRIHIRPQMPL